MKIVIEIPDKYLFRWKNLQEKVNAPDMESFIIHALGIGIQTINQALAVIGEKDDNVIQFDPEYYWSSDIGRKK